MATKLPTPTAQDLATPVFHLQLPLHDGKMFKFLVKPGDIPFISANAEMVKEELSKMITTEQENPIYFEIVDGKVALAECVLNTEDEEPVADSVEDIVEDEEDESATSRFEWKNSTTRQLLSGLAEKKTTSGNDFVITKKLWSEITKKISKSFVGTPPSTNQCREKFYSLKRSYRKFVAESNKTGNKRPKPFYFETEMELLLRDDPAFKPIIVKSSFGLTEDNNNNKRSLENQDSDEEDGDSQTSVPSTSTSCNSSTTPQSTRKRSKFDDLKGYLEQRDKTFLDAIKNMQDTQNKLMEKLIEKL